MNGYPYTTRDLLVDPPQHYHYSAFGGHPFLDGYVSDRHGALRRLDELCGSESGCPEDTALAGRLVERSPPIASPAIPVSPGDAETVATEEVLRACIRARLDGEDRVWRDWTEIFLAKFEFAKRLRRHYGASLKPVGTDRIQAGGYGLLAWLLSERTGGPTDLRSLNALLKVNDVVASTPLRGCGILAVVAARQAIGRELELVTALAASKGLVLEAQARGLE